MPRQPRARLAQHGPLLPCAGFPHPPRPIMSLLNVLGRLCFVAFFAMSALNKFQDLEGSVEVRQMMPHVSPRPFAKPCSPLPLLPRRLAGCQVWQLAWDRDSRRAASLPRGSRRCPGSDGCGARLLWRWQRGSNGCPTPPAPLHRRPGHPFRRHVVRRVDDHPFPRRCHTHHALALEASER